MDLFELIITIGASILFCYIIIHQFAKKISITIDKTIKESFIDKTVKETFIDKTIKETINEYYSNLGVLKDLDEELITLYSLIPKTEQLKIKMKISELVDELNKETQDTLQPKPLELTQTVPTFTKQEQNSKS